VVVIVVIMIAVVLFKGLVGFFWFLPVLRRALALGVPFVDAALLMPDHTMSLVQRTFRKRVRADSSIGIADLMDPFQKFFKARGSRDLKKLLDCPMDLDWKCVPQQRWLVRNTDLFKGLLSAAPNAVVTSRKLKDALKRLQEEDAINHTKKDNSDFYDWIDMKIRIGLSQLRDLKINTVTWERCMRRSTPEERTELKSIMEMIVLVGNDDSQETHCDDGGQEEEERQTAKSTKDEKKNPDIHTPQKKGSSAVDPAVTFALVERHETPPTSKVGASSGSSPTSLNKISPSKVFRGILKKKKKTKQQKKAEEEEGDGSSSEPVESSPPQINKKKALRRRLSFEDASESDEEEDKKAKLTILPAGKKIMNDKEKRKSRAEQTQHDGGGQTFLDSLLDAAVLQADEGDESIEAQGSNPNKSKEGSTKKRKEEEEGAAHKKSKKTEKMKETDLSAALALFLTL